MNTRRFFTLALSALFFISLTSFIPSKQDNWERLGTRSVNFKLDRDVIQVGANEGGFTKLKVSVTGGALNMHKLIVHYANGSQQNVALRHNFSRRSSSRVVDLNGGKRIIKKIVMVYDTKNAARSRAKVTVFGRH